MQHERGPGVRAPTTPRVTLALAALLAWAGLALPAAAHPLAPSLLELREKGSGRVEVLSGFLTVTDESGASFRLTLESVHHGHDPRLRATTRVLALGGGELSYEVCMATGEVNPVQPHLSGRLTRSAEEDGSPAA